MSSNYVFFNPSEANQLAKFQGSLSGIKAANSTITGVAQAPTSVFNQAGYYALQDTNTGYVTLQKLADDSLYTKQWYDQGTSTPFDFSGNTGTSFDPSSLSNHMSVYDIAALDN